MFYHVKACFYSRFNCSTTVQSLLLNCVNSILWLGINDAGQGSKMHSVSQVCLILWRQQTIVGVHPESENSLRIIQTNQTLTTNKVRKHLKTLHSMNSSTAQQTPKQLFLRTEFYYESFSRRTSKSCKADLSVLVILSCSPLFFWIKEISQFPERFHSLFKLAVKRESDLLENDRTAGSRAGLEFIWCLGDPSFRSRSESVKSFTRSCCIFSETHLEKSN